MIEDAIPLETAISPADMASLDLWRGLGVTAPRIDTTGAIMAPKIETMVIIVGLNATEAGLPLAHRGIAKPHEKDAFASTDTTVVKKTPPPEKQKPNFAPTGRLAAESNTVQSASGAAIILKYHEPPESRKPSAAHPWRMYVFKESQILDTVLLHERSCWLIGREAAVVDYLVEHPSTSKQHAVIQFRYVEKRSEYGDKTGRVRPYIIDLESANGTKVNGDAVPAGRYLELRDGDVVTFGESTREYVVQLPTT